MPTALELTAEQRRLQLALRAETVQDVMRVWLLLDPEALPDTWPGVETALQRIIEARRMRSAALAADYVADVRAAEGVPGVARAVFAEPVTAAALRISLRVLGLSTIERLVGSRAATPQQAARTALTRVAGGAGRHVLDGGRQTVVQTVRADEKAVGWARAASGGACHFCAMLAGRGPVYKSRRTVSFEAHDHCGCQAVPVYSRDAPWPANSQKFAEKWDDVTAGLSGRKAVDAFRKALTEGDT